MPEHDADLGADPTLQEGGPPVPGGPEPAGGDPTREGILSRTESEGFGGFVRGLGSMLLPQAGLPGKRGLGDILNDFVEFGSLGDIGDVGVALDPNSGLDPLERLIAALPLLGIGAIGTHTAYKTYQRKHLEALPQTAKSMLPAEGQGYDLESGFEELDGAQATAEQTRQQAAHFEQLALEADSPFAQHTLAADTWENLVLAVLPIRVVEGIDAGRHPFDLGRMDAALRGLGAAVMEISTQPKLYGSDFVAAKIAITKWNRAIELGIIPRPEGRDARTGIMMELLQADGVLNIVKIAQLEAATWMVGPDLSMSSPARFSQVWWEEGTNDIQVAYAMVDGLLPNERGFNYDTLMPIDAEIIRSKQQQIDTEGVQGVGAVNVARALLWTPAHAADNAGGLDAIITMDWYKKYNATSRALAEITDYTVEQVSGLIAALSASTRWIPDNMVGAVHVVLQTGRTDLIPGSVEYRAAFRKVTLEVGWGFDLFEGSSAEVQTQFEQQPGAPGGIPDIEGLTDFYSDPTNVTSPDGNLIGAADQTKKDKIDLILKGNLPAWLVLRMMKTNTFSTLGADPSLVDLVTIDVWSDRLWWGTRWVDTPLAHDGRINDTIVPDQEYHNPLDGQVISGEEVLRSLETLRNEHGWTKTQVKRWTRLLATYPSKLAQARFLAQARSNLLVRDEFGIETGNQVQAGGWAGVRERWGNLETEIADATTKEELRRIQEKGNLTTLLMTHLDGNPSQELTAAGMLWKMTSRIPSNLPTLQHLKDIQRGMQRPAASRAKGAIVVVSGVDGEVAVYADNAVVGVRETLRHATPTGLKVGPYELYISSEARQVVAVEDHFQDTTEYVQEDGRKAAGHQTMVFDPKSPEHPGTVAGDTVRVLVDNDTVEDVVRLLKEGYAFDYKVVNVSGKVTGLSRNQIITEDLEGISDGQLGEILQNNDWVAMTAFKDGATDGTNWDNQRLLVLDIERAGGAIIHGNGVYEGTSEASLFVTGMTYADAVRLGKKYGQNSVATRNGLLFMDGTYRPVQGEANFGGQANPRNHTILSTGQKFSFDYDFGQALPLPETAEMESLADGEAVSTPLTQITINMGGQFGGATWNITDLLLKKLTAIPGARIRYNTHSRNKIPGGFTMVSESVVADQAGITGSTLHKGGDVYARHQSDVYIPDWEVLTLSEDGFAGERTRRGPKDVHDILEIDEVAGMIWLDKDLVIQVDPSANVTMGKTGNIFSTLKVDGNLVRTIVVDTTGPVPVIEVGLDTIPAPGRTVVELSRGKATKIIPHGQGDWTAAKEALTGIGLIPDGQEVKVAQPEQVTSRLEDSTYRVIMDPFTTEGPVAAEGEASVRPVLAEDIALTERLQKFLPALKRVNLGKNAHQDLRGIIEDTLEGLHGKTDRYPGVKVVGAIDPKVWKRSVGIDTLHIINEPLTNAITGMNPKGGIIFNENTVHTRWNQGARSKQGELGVAVTGDFMKKPENMSDFEALIIHEMGHMTSRHFPNGQLLDMVEKAKKAMGPVGVQMNMSEYGRGFEPEFVAEAFVEVMAKGEAAHPALVELVRSVIEGLSAFEKFKVKVGL